MAVIDIFSTDKKYDVVYADPPWRNRVREYIEKIVGDVLKIELFARQSVDGWDCWGNEV